MQVHPDGFHSLEITASHHIMIISYHCYISYNFHLFYLTCVPLPSSGGALQGGGACEDENGGA